MDYPKVPNRIRIHGDQDKGQEYISFANSLLERCLVMAGFQGLEYFVMRRTLEDGTVIVVKTVFGQSMIDITPPPVPEISVVHEISTDVRMGGDFSVVINFENDPVFEWTQEDDHSRFERTMTEDIFPDGVYKVLSDVEEIYISTIRNEDGSIGFRFTTEDQVPFIQGVCSAKRIVSEGDPNNRATVCQALVGRNVIFVKDGDSRASHRVYSANGTFVDGFVAKGKDVVCFPVAEFGGALGRKAVVHPGWRFASGHIERTNTDRYKGGDITPTSRPLPDRIWSEFPHSGDACLCSALLVRISPGGFSRPDLSGSATLPQFSAPVCTNPPTLSSSAFFPVVYVERESIEGDYRDVRLKVEAFGAIHPLNASPFQNLLIGRNPLIGEQLLGFVRSWIYLGAPVSFAGGIVDFEVSQGALRVIKPMPVHPTGGGGLLGSDDYLYSGETAGGDPLSYLSKKRVHADSWPPETEELVSSTISSSWTNNYLNILNKASFETVETHSGAVFYGLENARHYFHTGYDNSFRLRSPLYVGGSDRLSLMDVSSDVGTILEVDARPFESDFDCLFAYWTTFGLKQNRDISLSCAADVSDMTVNMKSGEEYPTISISHGKSSEIKFGGSPVFYNNFSVQEYHLKLVSEGPISNHLYAGDMCQLHFESDWADKPPVDTKWPFRAILVGDTPVFWGVIHCRSEDRSPFFNAQHETQVDDLYVDFFSYSVCFRGDKIAIATPFVWATNWGFSTASFQSSTSGQSLPPHVYCFDYRQEGYPKVDIFCEAINRDESLYRDPRFLPEEDVKWRVFLTFNDDAPLDVSEIFWAELKDFLLSVGRSEEELEGLEKKICYFNPSGG